LRLHTAPLHAALLLLLLELLRVELGLLGVDG
jgi:hypothetical protein